MNRVKNWILLFLILFSVQGLANDRYYGQWLYQYRQAASFGNFSAAPQLRRYLQTVLNSYHMPQTDNFDQIVNQCPSGESESCYRHVYYNYRTARQYLFGYLHLRQDSQGNPYIKDAYCEYKWTEKELGQYSDNQGVYGFGPMKIPDHQMINCEHTWPQSRFKTHADESYQKSDLHHLFPVASFMNSTRSNYLFGEVTQVANNTGSVNCSGSKLGYLLDETGSYISALFFEPPDSHKGNVARAIFYFATKYHHPINDVEEKFLRRWHFQDPPDQEEVIRNEYIFMIQKVRNPYIDYPELVQHISNF